jgi:hypothetical protein
MEIAKITEAFYSISQGFDLSVAGSDKSSQKSS